MAQRIWNFNPGPATLPLSVLEKAKKDIPNYNNTGMSVMEISHRSEDYKKIHSEAKSLLKSLFNIPDDYNILFLQGGASLQFAMIPMNLLSQGSSADYLITGRWSKKAITEANIIAEGKIAGSSEDKNFSYIPKNLDLHSNAEYAHLTSNNTIAGTQWHTFPDTGNVPLIADMSSDILSRKLDVGKFGLIYAGAQKNLGPAGVTIVIIRKDLVEKARNDIPTLLKYATHVEKDSAFNTPPTFAIYMVKLVLEWIEDQGGLEKIEQTNREKAETLYTTMDNNSDFYKGAVEKEDRSLMNITLRLPSEELEKKFIAEGAKAGFGGLKGHRSVGGVRISIYNAMPLKGVKELNKFMINFAKKNG